MAFINSKNSLSARQARYGATAMLYTIIVIAALILVNWLANRYNKTYDTTSNKQFTLSPETKKIVQNLKQDATITYIDAASGFNQAKGLLDRYENLSPKIHVRYVDYKAQPVIARSYGLRFPGTAYVEIGSRREEAKSMTEEGVTSAFLKDLKGVRKVCFVTGSHEHQLDDTSDNGLSRFKSVLERDNYQADPVSLLDKTEVPGDCKVLVVAGPQMNYTANEITGIKNYIEHGGRAMLLIDPPLDFGRTQVAPNDALDSLLTSWGVTPQKDLVLEENPMGQLFGFGPEVPLVATYESHAIVNDLKGAATGFPLSRSLQVKNGATTTVSPLFSTTSRAIATTKLSSNQVNPNDPSNKKGPFVLGAAGTYNTGKPNDPGRFVVIGSSGFVDNAMLGFQANRDLAVNAVNWLSSDEDLISIRPKAPEDRRLNVTQRQMNMMVYTILIALPLLIIVSGVSIFLKRR
jgi:ABC-type uncharacterized transport system involved in gliding motility auxiliary subunit